MKPVGKFHDDHPDVIGHGEDHLSHVLGFLLLGAAELHLADLGDPVHDVGGFLAEEPFDLAQFRGRVLDGVVEETGCHADHIHFHLGEEVSHLQGMGKVGLPGQAHLALVDLGGVHVGLFDEAHVRLRMVAEDLGGDVI